MEIAADGGLGHGDVVLLEHGSGDGGRRRVGGLLSVSVLDDFLGQFLDLLAAQLDGLLVLSLATSLRLASFAFGKSSYRGARHAESSRDLALTVTKFEAADRFGLAKSVSDLERCAAESLRHLPGCFGRHGS